MPLQATHIKFALDLKDSFSINSLNEYLSGTVYPDSRMKTGVPRNLTHDIEALKAQHLMSDFHKGWYAHCICDEKFLSLSAIVFPDLLGHFETKAFGSDWWVVLTAIKTMLEYEVLKMFDVKEYLPLLDGSRNPNSEPTDMINNYYRSIKDSYKNEISLNDLLTTLSLFGVPEDLSDQIRVKTEELKTKISPDDLKGLYFEMSGIGRTKVFRAPQKCNC